MKVDPAIVSGAVVAAVLTTVAYLTLTPKTIAGNKENRHFSFQFKLNTNSRLKNKETGRKASGSQSTSRT